MAGDKIKISATRLKTLEDCSWRYYAQYVLRAPQEDTVALVRGSLVHLVLELLTVPRHHKYYYEAISKKSALKIKAIKRMVEKHASNGGFGSGEDLAMIDEMIMTALEYDFLCKGAVGCDSEKEFNIHIGNDVYLNGFIDRVLYREDGSLSIRDYKTSKSKFAKEELQKNYQAMIYSLACFIEMGEIPDVEFIFLKFKRKPDQKAPRCSEKKLEGFKHHLMSVAPKIKGFNHEDAISNLARGNREKGWLCGKRTGDINKEGKPAYICPYKYSFDYYELVDKSGKTVEMARNVSDLKKTTREHSIVVKKYPGCPAWQN